MKKFKMADLLKKDQKALSEEASKLQQELLKVLQSRRTSASSKSDSRESSKLKKQIARVKTAERQLVIASAKEENSK